MTLEERIAIIETCYKTVVKPMYNKINKLQTQVNKNKTFVDNAEKDMAQIIAKKLSDNQKELLQIAKANLGWRVTGVIILLIGILITNLWIILSKL